jgi:hypothetical protein
MNLFAAQRVAIPTSSGPGHGRVDYLLHVDKRVAGRLRPSLWNRPRRVDSGSRRCTRASLRRTAFRSCR